MEATVFGLLTAGGTFAGSRFTRLHPLLIASLGAMVWAALGALIMMAFAHQAWPVMAGLAFVVGWFPAGIGAFLGWLRRTHLERELS